jgi:hypothetical protein
MQNVTPDCDKKLYKFIINQIKDTKYMYLDHKYAIFDLGKTHYGLTGYTDDEWEYAFMWAIANNYNGGCESQLPNPKG